MSKSAGQDEPNRGVNDKKQKKPNATTGSSYLTQSTPSMTDTKNSEVSINHISDNDPIGTHMARLLNEGAFEKLVQTASKCGQANRSLFPLVSASNFARLKEALNDFLGIFYDSKRAIGRDESKTISWWQSLQSLFKALLFFFVILSVVSSFIVIIMVKVYVVVAISLFTLLFDVQDIFNNLCPKIIQQFVINIAKYFQEIDKKYLCAHLSERTKYWGEQTKNPLMDRKAPKILQHARIQLENDTVKASVGASFQNIDWNTVITSFRADDKEGQKVHAKNVDHLITLNFAYVMIHGDHNDSHLKSKKKSRKRLGSTDRKCVRSVTEDRIKPGIVDAVTNEVETTYTGKLNKIDTMQSTDGIEVMKVTPRPTRMSMKRQKSNIFRASLSSFDNDMNGETFGLNLEDEFDNTPRQRIYSETDLDFYGSDENSLLGVESPDEKNKKWLDVGAKIGMRILKSEQVQDLIAQTQTASADNGDTLECDLTFEGTCNTEVKNYLDSSTPQIPKPFHAMWEIEGDQIFDDASAGFISSDSETSTLDKKVRTSTISRMKAQNRPSLSPRRTREDSINTNFSVPSSSPSLISNRASLKNERSAENEENVSIMSSEAIQWVPREYNANRHLPASMAINHDVLSNKRSSTNINQILSPKDIRLANIAVGQGKKHRCREALLPGVKMVVPLFPVCSTSKSTRNSIEGRVHQFATVLSSKRIALSSLGNGPEFTDALSITVLLDKAFLRNGKFATMTMRILDSNRHFPRHSKFPIGDAIATSFGLGILVGWRSKDDCHILRALWKKRGQGSSHAYLNRNALHAVMEASVGFEVTTRYGSGKVIGYINGGVNFTEGQYLVRVKKNGRQDNELTTMKKTDVYKCTSAKFIPVVEQLKEAAKYQMQVDNYQAEKLQLLLQDETLLLDKTWHIFSQSFELLLSSFIKACEEDENFDSEISNFLLQFISFLEDFEVGGARRRQKKSSLGDGNSVVDVTDECKSDGTLTEKFVGDMKEPSSSMKSEVSDHSPGLWFLSDLFSDVNRIDHVDAPGSEKDIPIHRSGATSYKKVYAVLTILMRTVSITEAGCTDKPNFKMALAIIHETLLFVHNVIKVQQVNMTEAAVNQWKETIDELAQLFGPMNARFRKVSNGILQRIENHGKIAKVRALAFAELLVVDDKLIESLEAGDGNDCIARIENAAVSAEIINEDARMQYHKLATLLYNTLTPRTTQKNSDAAARNGKKFTFLAKAIKVLATPARSALSLLTNDDMLELIERVLVRVFEKEQDASQIINIYSWTFRTFRHLRILINIAVVGNLWAAILNAADEEFSWAVSRTPKNTQQYIKPIAKLFSLGVARFHELHSSDSSVSADWLDFLMEDEAIEIIQDLDGALLLFVQNFCSDMKDMMYILPYYSSIDDDILDLIDEVDPERELKEIAEALGDPDKFPTYVREKSAKAVSVFLEYLPKMSIPIERREVGEGWVLTCRGRNDNDLTLSNVSIEKDNLFCRVFGSQVLGLDEIDLIKKPSMSSVMKDSVFPGDDKGNIEVSILDHVAELIRNAQSHGCWNIDSGNTPPSSFLAASPLEGLPLSEVLHCAIELWENLQLDDDELLEIAIREISCQIQMHKAKDDDSGVDIDSDKKWPEEARRIQRMHQEYARRGISFDVDICNTLTVESSSSATFNRKAFNPRKDPTVLYLAMNQLTCFLDDFTYRLEPSKSNSIFDPVIEGVGTLAIKNASIKIRVECRKERISKLGEDLTIPVLQLQELEVGLEKVQFKFKETGADWLLNKVVSNFFDKITQIVKENLRKQMALSVENALETLNKYIEVNPDLMLKILGISIDDLEENVAWV